MGELLDDITMQPELLRRLARRYSAGPEHELLARLDVRRPPLLTGMGASYHAALVAATQLQALGVPARAVEATNLLFYGAALLDASAPLVFVSQSGASAEVTPLVERLPAGAALLAVTNTAASPLGAAAHAILPTLAGPGEAFVATRTYTTSLAVLWLLARRWAGAPPDSAPLDAAATAYEGVLARRDALVARWLAVLGDAQTLVFLGHGPHAATARQAAMMVNEWGKLPALGGGAGAFRHGVIEIVQPGVGVVIFAAPGPAYASSCALADELAGYGARVLLVEHGRSRAPGEPSAPPPVADEFLAPLLDVLPVQLFVDALPARSGSAAGFRHIAKVVTRL